MKKIMLAVTAAAALALTLTACSGGGTQAPTDGGDAGGGETTTLKVAQVGIMSDATLQIAEEQGFLEEEGLELELTTVANPPAGVAALQGGQVDIAFSPGVVYLNALAQGVPLQVVAGASGFPDGIEPGSDEFNKYDDTGVFVNPDSGITSLKDLEGKTVAVNARKAQLEVTLTKALADEGVDPSTINWVALDFTSMGEALKNNQVDAAVLVNPFTLRATEDGMELINYPAASFFGPGATSFWLTSAQTAKDKADAIEAFNRAINKANAYANEHQEEAIAIGIELAGLDIPVEEAGLIYWPLTVTQEDIDSINENLVELGFLDKLADTSNALLPYATTE